MAIVEGIGDEVLICVFVFILLGIILFAWGSTRVRPLFNSGSVWMVHMQTAPERRVLEVYSLDESSAASQQSPANTSTSAVADLSVDSSGIVNTESSSTNANTIQATTNETSPLDNSSENQQRQDRHSSDGVCSSSTCSESVVRRRIVTSERSGESSTNVVDESGIQNSSTESNVDADTTTIKLKFLDDTQKLVAAWLTQTVGEFKRQHFETDVSQGKVVRLIYRGQLLRDDTRSLASYGLHENCVLHCHVSTTPYEQQHSATGSTRSNDNSAHRPMGTTGGGGGGGNGVGFNNGNNATGLDFGRYIYVIFAFKFACLWSAWFVFPEYFSRTSLVSLILCSGLFMLFWYGSQRRRPMMEIGGNNRHQ